MKYKLAILKDEAETLIFTIKHINVSYINGLRRTILSDIPSVVFDIKETTFHSNTSRLNNEILKQRLQCVPIYIKDLTIPLENYVVKISDQNDGDSIKYITTENFHIKNIQNDKFLDSHEVKKIFPPDPKTTDYILFARLKPKVTETIPGEKLEISAKMMISTAKESGMYNVAHTVSYHNSIDPVSQRQAWNSHLNELKKKTISADQIELEKMDWHNHAGKRYFLENSFEFIVETLGVYTNKELIQIACDVIIGKLQKIIANKEHLRIETSKTTIPYCYDIQLKDEDYTIGKIIEFILHSEFFQKKKCAIIRWI